MHFTRCCDRTGVLDINRKPNLPSVSRFLFRGVSAERFSDVVASLCPKSVGAFVAPLNWDEFNWDEAEWDTTELNAVVRHQWEQRGLPTSGISTTPILERAGFYAQSGSSSGTGFVLVIDRQLLREHSVREFVVSELVQSPAVPEDNEVILVAANGGGIPEAVVVEVRPWP